MTRSQKKAARKGSLSPAKTTPARVLDPSRHPGGRPSKYTLELATEICERLAKGELGTEICALDHMPTWTSLWRWQDAHPEFRKAYAEARERQQHFFADMILTKSRDESRDYYVDRKGDRHSDNTAVQRDRLIVDSHKWVMARLASKMYGDKTQQEITGADGAPLVPVLNIHISKDGSGGD